MPGRAPLRASSPSHPRLDSGKGEWHSQWYLATRNVAQRWVLLDVHVCATGWVVKNLSSMASVGETVSPLSYGS
jgi:hypothetical protein